MRGRARGALLAHAVRGAAPAPARGMSGSSTAPPSSASSSSPAPAPFRGPAADSRLGELLLDALPLACAVGHALDLSHCLALCGTTWRRGVARADGSVDRAGFLGGTNDMMARSLERQAPWLAEARAMRRDAAAVSGGLTQLIRAARVGDEQRVRELVAAGASVDRLVGEFGQTALHEASLYGHVRVVKLLLDGKFEGKGAGVNTISGSGGTPLIYATMRSHEAVVRLLLERGADAVQRTRHGTAPLSVATTDAIRELLRAHGATA